ncbi:hypothetical protein FRC06_008312, partial [Ceratobasidium sp. 370]
LLAASPHVKDHPATYDAPDTLPSAVLVPPALSGPSTTPGAGPPNKTINRTKPPAHAIHTPQQPPPLQPEAIAQAQPRSTPESPAVSDEEKYLAAQ